MGRHSKTVIEYRSYEFPPHFPLRVIAGEEWRISDVPSGVLHFHNCLEIGICESDSGKMNFSGKVVPFKAGDITFVAGDVPHTTWSDPGCASKWSYIFTDAEELLRPFFDPAALPNSRLLAQVLHGWSGIFSSADHPALANYVKMILQEMQTRSLNYEISVRGLFVALITEVMRLSTEQNDSASANRMVIAPALTYIDEFYMENFSIRDLADACSMSESHFRRVFRELVGMGPLDYLNRTRIAKACSLLRMTDDSILTISEKVGFGSMSSFNRHFYEVMGTAPSDWRRATGTGNWYFYLEIQRLAAPANPITPETKREAVLCKRLPFQIIDCGLFADSVDRFQFLCRKARVLHCFDVIQDLAGFRCTDQHGRNLIMAQQPGQGHFSQRLSAGLGNIVQGIDLSDFFRRNILFFQKSPVCAYPAVSRNPLQISVGQQSLCQRTEGDNSLMQPGSHRFQAVIFNRAVKNRVAVLIDDKRHMQFVQNRSSFFQRGAVIVG